MYVESIGDTGVVGFDDRDGGRPSGLRKGDELTGLNPPRKKWKPS